MLLRLTNWALTVRTSESHVGQTLKSLACIGVSPCNSVHMMGSITARIHSIRSIEGSLPQIDAGLRILYRTAGCILGSFFVCGRRHMTGPGILDKTFCISSKTSVLQNCHLQHRLTTSSCLWKLWQQICHKKIWTRAAWRKSLSTSASSKCARQQIMRLGLRADLFCRIVPLC